MWEEHQLQAFAKLKSTLASAPIVSAPNWSIPFTIQCDASQSATGAILTQGTGPDERVIAYHSQKLSKTERNYPTHDKELLAVINALKTWCHYGKGGHFTVYTDNWAVKHALTQPHLSTRQIKWLEFMADYDFDLLHK